VALGKIGDNQAIKPLLAVLENISESPSIRDAVAWALLQLDETKSCLIVMRYLKHNHQDNFNFLRKGTSLFPSEFYNAAPE
jgi:HEAT repeat protein